MSSECPNKERCGSCSWSHIPYEKQLQQKLSDINGSFKLKELELEVTEIAPSPKQEHYRNRMDFVIDFEGRVGMREKGKWWKVIDGHHCFLADELIEKNFDIVRDWSQKAGLSFFDRKAHTGLLRYAVIRSTTTGESMMTIVTSEPENELEAKHLREELKKLAHVCEESSTKQSSKTASAPSQTSIIHAINETVSDVSFGAKLETISGPGYIEEVINKLRYRITPNAFFQTNPHGAAMLMDTVSEFVGDLSDKTLLDLYCGSGFFSIALASKVCEESSTKQSSKTASVPSQTVRTIGVELVPEAIVDAKVNAELNNVDIEFHEAKTEEFDWGEFGADTVILDPPRSGMHDKALADVLRVRPETIIYISCNYKNFAREFVQLQEFYKVESIRAVDMFPHTPHVELVTKLVRK